MARQYYAVEALAEATTTSATAVPVTTLTFTPEANSDYLLFFSAQATCDSTTDDDRVIVDLADVEAGYALLWRNEIRAHEFSGPQDYASVFGIAKVSFGASPGAHSYDAVFNSSASGQTVKVKNVRIIAIKAAVADQFAATSGLGSQTSSTFSTYQALTFTPASTGDYLVLAVAAIASDVNAGNVAARLVHATASVSYGGRTLNVIDDFENRVFAVAPKISLPNASQTFNLQYNSPDNTTVAYCLRGAILALRLDGFDEVFQGQDFGTPVGTTSTSYQNGLTVSGTPQAVAHLIIGTAVQRIASTSRTSWLQAITDNPAGTFFEFPQEPAANASYYPVGFAAITTPANSATTWRWQYKSETTSQAYAGDQTLAVLRLAAASTVTRTASFDAAVQRAIAATASADAAVQTTLAATAGVDAAAAVAGALAASLDAATQTLRTAGAALDAAVRTSLSAGLGANAAVQSALNVSLAASAAVLGQPSGATLADAAVAAERASQAGFDAALARLQTMAVGIDAHVQRLISFGVACDVVIKRALARGAIIDLSASLSPVARLQGVRQAGTTLQGKLARVVELQGRIGTDGASR